MAASANQSVVSGAGGPTKPIQVMDFSIATPIDVARATETLCGSPQMFHMMLGKFEDMTFL
jgi:HPt (histidine-containing phosphotransfer) domain-containing protein